MTETWFTSDTHFAHDNILKFEPEVRPFETIDEHDQALIKNWNSVVADGDLVWHLGDLLFKRDREWLLSHLNGTKFLILGNHDKFKPEFYSKYFARVRGASKFDRDIICTHYPVHTCQFPRYILNVHGHLHKNSLEDYRYFNVCTSLHKLTPVHISIILQRKKDLIKRDNKKP